jgi:SSS family solute:Na+ symporter
MARNVRNVDAAVGVISGVFVIACISIDTYLGLPETGIHEYLAIVFGTMTIFLVGFVMAKLFAPRKC